MEQGKKIKILLVDDDEMMRIYFRDIFWVHGRSDKYEVIIASSIEEAETKITDKDSKPDTIFLDVMMPIKDGDNSPANLVKRCLSFISRVKSDPSFKDTKIVVYSGQKEKSIQEAVYKLGVDGYLVKGELMPKEIIAFTDKLHGTNN
jgi:CheY-like chemotaxis protein